MEGRFSPCHGGGERCCGVLSLAKIWTEELRDLGARLLGAGTPALSSAALAYVCQPQVCSSFSQAEL